MNDTELGKALSEKKGNLNVTKKGKKPYRKGEKKCPQE